MKAIRLIVAVAGIITSIAGINMGIGDIASVVKNVNS